MALKSFGKTVQALRKDMGLTQEQLGEMCDRHPVYISEIERGVKSPSLETILRLCKALNITPGDIMNLAFQSGETTKIKNQIMVLINRKSSKDLRRIHRMIEAYGE